MANNYFQFKQFTIYQDKCAMKVCTDACLFGAFVANELQNNLTKNILDIGTGTGLLSLMLAQKTNATIDAIEIDKEAFEQAKENINQSPFKESVTISNEDILNFVTYKKYDCIICNPPFYESDLKSGNTAKDAAMHSSTLTIKDLLAVTKKLSTPDGSLYLLLPFNRLEYVIAEAEKINWSLNKTILVKQSTKHNHFRAIVVFTKEKNMMLSGEISIKNDENSYTPEFIDLLKDYYLQL